MGYNEMLLVSITLGGRDGHPYRHDTVANHYLAIAMRQTALSNARYENAIAVILERRRTLATGNAEAQSLSNLIPYQCRMQLNKAQRQRG